MSDAKLTRGKIGLKSLGEKTEVNAKGNLAGKEASPARKKKSPNPKEDVPRRENARGPRGIGGSGKNFGPDNSGPVTQAWEMGR